jgi:N-acylglucosamine 2-epimerase
MQHYAELYKQELLNNIIPFWLDHSKDNDEGGYFSCFDQFGKVYDTDKFVWLQAREIWMFATLYDKVEKNPEWLAIAEWGAEFLTKHGRDKDGNWYFSLDRKGFPVTQPFSIITDCYASMAYGALFKITGDPTYSAIALSTFNNILARREDPKGKYNKAYPGTRPMRSFSISMIICNLSLELERFIDNKIVDKLMEEVISEIMGVFYNPESQLVHENVLADGSFSDSFEGRLINPGHGLEAMGFIMDIGQKRGDRQLIERACAIAFSILEKSWDLDYGGIFYFLDSKNHPLQQLEWDQKLWWVHVESLVCMAKAFSLTRKAEAEHWFLKIHGYTWSHFRDSKYPEWFGYLNRRGDVLSPLKGGKWKGCFHIPRGMLQVWKSLEHVSTSV